MVEHPFLYEINTWVWLEELGVGLADVPSAEWDAIAALGFDAVWLMGVWERSPAGVEIALRNEGLVESFRRALPDLTRADWQDSVTDDQIRDTIKNGRNAMPKFDLPPAVMQGLVQRIRTNRAKR